jgi:tetratricopeptide (TPR) repeat protein
LQSESFLNFMNRLEQLMQMLESNSDDPFLNYAIAMEYVSSEDFSAAIEKLEWLHQNKSDYLPVYYQLAHLYQEANRTDDAIQIYEQGIEVALAQKEMKTAGELRSALEELTF